MTIGICKHRLRFQQRHVDRKPNEKLATISMLARKPKEKLGMANVLSRREWPALIVSFVVTFAAAGIGSQFMPGAWYRDLQKPWFNPPDAAFGPVWTALYALMAVAVWLVWLRRHVANVKPALAAFGVQLALNAAWSWLFFGRHQIGWALIDITLLWMAILLTTVLFWRLTRTAGVLLFPYLVWVSFAALLNASFWQLNG